MKKPDKYKIIFAVIMALFFVWGICVFRDYGISWDEGAQRSKGLAGMRTVITTLFGADKVPARLLEDDVAAYNYGGVGYRLPVLLAEMATGFTLSAERAYKLYHLYVFLFFFLSAFFAYSALRLLGFDKKYSLTGLVLYLTCPRILADSFYNIKDLMLLSFFTILIALSMWLVKDFTYKKAVLLAVFTAFANTQKTMSAFPVLIFALYYFFVPVIKKDRTEIVSRVKKLAVCVASCMAVLFVITPKLWLNFSETMVKKVTTTFNYTHGGFDMVAGMLMNRMDLPWYYLLLTITMTVPCIYVIFSCVGSLSFAGGIFVRKAGEKEDEVFSRHMLWLIWGQFAFFMIYPIVMRPMQYNLWRHFYFVFIYIVIFTVYGIRFVAEKGRMQAVLTSLFCVISVLLTLVWIGKNHPYEYLYFNPAFRGEAAKNTVQDYWAVSYKGLLSQIKDGSVTDVSIFPSLVGDVFFGDPGWENYHLESIDHSAKYRIEEGNPGDNNIYRILKTVEVDSRICESLVRRENFSNLIRKYYIENGRVSGKNYGDEAEIEHYSEGTDRCICISLPASLKVKEADLLYESDSVVNERVYVSDNDYDWRLMEGDCVRKWDDLFAVADEEYLPSFILIKYECTSPSDPDIAIRLFGEDASEKTTRGDIAFNSKDSRENTELVSYPGADGESVKTLFDGSDKVSPDIFSEMKGGEEVRLSLRENAGQIAGFRLDCGSSPMSAPRGIEIEGSYDGESYSPISFSYGSADDYVFDSPTDYRYFIIRQTGESTHALALSEIGLLRQP